MCANLKIADKLTSQVINQNICCNCGACVALDTSKKAFMRDDLLPNFSSISKDLPCLAWDSCPGKGINYPELYRKHYGSTPANWLLGHYKNTRTGHSSDATVRNNASSGGIITQTLIHMLDNDIIDYAIVVQQGISHPEKSGVIITNKKEDILKASQSVYIPTPLLQILPKLEEKRYAITCTPEQAAALRWLQHSDHEQAQKIKYVIGPYTGTAMYPGAIRAFLRSKGIKPDDTITSLKWRAGEWPGYLEISMQSGAVIRSPKFYYNYLIPFYVTQTSLQSIDFTNEFCDLSVGDAWHPQYEKERKGMSVFTTRNQDMETIIKTMIKNNKIQADIIDPKKSLNMHGHMLDFKKRGSFIRNKLRKKIFRKNAPFYHMKPQQIPKSRWIVEVFLLAIFTICHTRIARTIVQLIPEKILGSCFNTARKTWKYLSKPTKRKNLAKLEFREIDNEE
jgi:coenzyme F420 hydrogenase subunit beta